MATATRQFEVVRMGEVLGAEVRGVDLSKKLDEEAIAFVKQAWRDNLVLLFRNQELFDEDLVAAAEAFGGSQVAGSRAYFLKAGHKEGSARVSKTPGITVISNLDDDGKPVVNHSGTGSLELYWHTDNSYVENPPKGSLLYSHQVPVKGGGDTSFVNQYMAFETLPEDTKRKIIGLHIRQDNTRNTAGHARPTATVPKTQADVTGPVHPLVRVHPETGRIALYLGRRWQPPSSYIVELPEKESDALLDELWAHATQERFRWTHVWQPKDLIMWDNRCTMHKRSAVDPTQPRVMHRTLIKGEAIVPATLEKLQAAHA